MSWWSSWFENSWCVVLSKVMFKQVNVTHWGLSNNLVWCQPGHSLHELATVIVGAFISTRALHVFHQSHQGGKAYHRRIRKCRHPTHLQVTKSLMLHWATDLVTNTKGKSKSYHNCQGLPWRCQGAHHTCLCHVAPFRGPQLHVGLKLFMAAQPIFSIALQSQSLLHLLPSTY